MDGRTFAAEMRLSYMGVFKILKGQSASLQTPQHFAACALLRIRPEWLMSGDGEMGLDSSSTVDYRTLTLMVIAEHPDASARELMLELIELVDSKAAQLRQVAGARAKAHTP